MTYDHAKIQQLLEIARTRKLTTAERTLAREQIELFNARKLASLQKLLFDALGVQYPEKLDPYDIDEYIHRYHKQSQEWYKHVNYHSASNERLPLWLAEIDDDEQGIRVWEPETRLPHEEEQSSEEV